MGCEGTSRVPGKYYPWASRRCLYSYQTGNLASSPSGPEVPAAPADAGWGGGGGGGPKPRDPRYLPTRVLCDVRY
eukprot:723257-Rhodomonas_salina.1